MVSDCECQLPERGRGLYLHRLRRRNSQMFLPPHPPIHHDLTEDTLLRVSFSLGFVEEIVIYEKRFLLAESTCRKA